MNKNLKSAIYKSNKNSYSKTGYHGYLTSCEIIELLNLPVYPHHSRTKEWKIEQKKKGISNPTWFYFQPNNHFLKLKERIMNESKKNE